MDRLELARKLSVHAVEAPAAPARATVIAEREPEHFMAAFAAAVAGGGEVFLADPNWTDAQRAQLEALLPRAGSTPELVATRGWLMIPSGGTSGKLKFARHDEETLAASVRGFCGHFGLQRVNALGVLPLYHVGGLLAWLRCKFTDGEYLPANWKALETGELPALRPNADWVISLVPTQLQRLLTQRDTVAWLQRFRAIFIGGGPAWPELLDAAAHARLPISLSFGMTETAAMVTALRPAEFIAGARSSGPMLSHASVTVDAEGVVGVSGPSLFRGYYPEWRDPEAPFKTDDLGHFDAKGHLHVLGRRDAMIITGGKKVHPADVEALLRASGEFSDVAVIGVPDVEWGEIVVACYPASGREPLVGHATLALANYQRPKRFVAIAEWPRNAQGKINRAALLAMVTAGTRKS